MKSNEEIKSIYTHLLDIPKHKLLYILSVDNTTYLEGLFVSIKKYGVPLTEEVFYIYYDAIDDKLTDGSGIEYEYEEKQYNNLMKIKEGIALGWYDRY